MLSSAFSLLDYDKIKTRLLSYTVSHLGRQQVEALTPSTDVLQIKRWLTETEEALRVIASSSVPIPSLFSTISCPRCIMKRSRKCREYSVP